MSRYMAFDFGTKRLGIAVTDPLKIIATGLTTIHPKDVGDFLEKYLQTEQVECFIVGDPKQMDGSASQSAVHVKAFVNQLRKKFPEIPIVLVDERFTSKMASAAMLESGMKKSDRRNKALVDTIAATLILQTYMQMI